LQRGGAITNIFIEAINIRLGRKQAAALPENG